MRRLSPLIVAFVLLASCASEGSGSPTTTAPTDTTTAARPCVARTHQRDVAYIAGDDPLQRLDIYLPEGVGCDPVPVVVWVHGGGWQIGDKGNSITQKVALWNDAGWAVVSVNYRLSDSAVPEAARVMAPQHNEDVAAALGWLVEHSAAVGIDPKHIALLGHSAGAGIVAALATDPVYLRTARLEPADLSCVGPLDTEAFSVAEAIGGGPELAKVYRVAFGTDPEQWAELSPLTHVGEAPIPPLFLVSRGTASRRNLVATFAAAVDTAGGETTIVDLPSFSHEDVNKQIGGAADTQLTPALQEFLTTCLTG